MSDTKAEPLHASSFSPVPAETPEQQAEVKRKKKKDKVRSAWISFVGRILAQMLGAVATVVLGLLVVTTYQPGRHDTEPAAEGAGETALPAKAPRPDGLTTLAVLPVENFSGDSRQDAFVDALTEAFIATLAQERGLQVTSRTSSMHFKGQHALLPAIARALDVDYVLEASMVLGGERVRITAQLIDAKTDVHIWARIYDPADRDVLALQSSVARVLARDVRGVVIARVGNELTRRRAAVPPAAE